MDAATMVFGAGLILDSAGFLAAIFEKGKGTASILFITGVTANIAGYTMLTTQLG